MFIPPLSVWNTYPEPNYVDPELRPIALVVMNWIFVVIITVVTALRLYARICVVQAFGWDDILIIPALVSPIPRPCPVR